MPTVYVQPVAAAAVVDALAVAPEMEWSEVPEAELMIDCSSAVAASRPSGASRASRASRAGWEHVGPVCTVKVATVDLVVVRSMMEMVAPAVVQALVAVLVYVSLALLVAGSRHRVQYVEVRRS